MFHSLLTFVEEFVPLVVIVKRTVNLATFADFE